MESLTGSEKQVRWASEIRSGILDQIENFEEDLTEDYGISLEEMRDVLASIKPAKFWIDGFGRDDLNGTTLAIMARTIRAVREGGRRQALETLEPVGLESASLWGWPIIDVLAPVTS